MRNLIALALFVVASATPTHAQRLQSLRDESEQFLGRRDSPDSQEFLDKISVVEGGERHKQLRVLDKLAEGATRGIVVEAVGYLWADNRILFAIARGDQCAAFRIQSTTVTEFRISCEQFADLNARLLASPMPPWGALFNIRSCHQELLRLSVWNRQDSFVYIFDSALLGKDYTGEDDDLLPSYLARSYPSFNQGVMWLYKIADSSSGDVVTTRELSHYVSP